MTGIVRQAVEAVEANIPGPREGYIVLSHCPWCAPNSDGAYCFCNEKCGESNCPHEEDWFTPPPVPVFRQEDD